MKGIVRIMYVMLLSAWVLTLTGCKAKEKVSESFTENVQVRSIETAEGICHDERHERENSTEQTIRTLESDSVVEKFRERVVVDSWGRVLFKDSEHTKERYRGKGTTRTDRQEDNRRAAMEQATKQSQTVTDTTATKKRSNTVKTKKPTCRWLWFPGLLALLFVSGVIIRKMTR